MTNIEKLRFKSLNQLNTCQLPVGTGHAVRLLLYCDFLALVLCTKKKVRIFM